MALTDPIRTPIYYELVKSGYKVGKQKPMPLVYVEVKGLKKVSNQL